MTESEPVLARFAKPTAETKTRLAILTDLHLTTEQTGTWRVSHRTEERLAATVDALNQQSLDAVIFAGDLVQSGLRAEYEAFDRIIDDLEAPFFAIPGNHDLIRFEPGDVLTLPEFEERYTPGELPFHERIGGVDVLALNSNRSTRTAVAESYVGRLDESSLAWLEDALATAENPLVIVHHNLPETRALLLDALERLPVTGGSPDFENSTALVDVLVEGGKPLVLTGHVHFPAVTTNRGVTEFTLPSLGPYPNVYTVLEIDDRGTTAYMHSVADYDERLESFRLGLEHSRVMLAASQLAGLPLVDEMDRSD